MFGFWVFFFFISVNAKFGLMGTGNILNSRSLLGPEVCKGPVGGEGRSCSQTQKHCTGTLWGKGASPTCRSRELEMHLLHIMSFLFFLLSLSTSTKQEGKFMVQELEMRLNDLFSKIDNLNHFRVVLYTVKSPAYSPKAYNSSVSNDVRFPYDTSQF